MRYARYRSLRVHDFTITKVRTIMAADDSDPFEQGKLARFNKEAHKNPYPPESEQSERWEAGYNYIEQGMHAA